jgi:hypothetical protein
VILGPYFSHFIAGGLCVYLIHDVNYSIKSVLNFKNFQDNLLKLIEKGKKFTPSFDFTINDNNINKKLPNEIRQILKPINAFPKLRKNFTEKLFVFPEWTRKILEERLKNQD